MMMMMYWQSVMNIRKYIKKLCKTEFSWDKNSLFQWDTVSSIYCVLDKDIIRESIRKLKNGEDTGLLSEVLQMVKVVGEAAVEMITDLVNQIKVEEVIPKKWEFSTIVNCYMGKGNSLEGANSRGLKLTDTFLNIA